MSNKSRFRGPFDKQHGKRAQALWKSSSQHLYHIPRSLPRKLSWKKSLLLTCKIFGLLVNILATDEKYLLLHRDNSKIPIQVQLSQKQKKFSQFSPAFLKSRLNFKHFEKKMILAAFVFPKLQTPESWLDKRLKSPVSEDYSTSNMVKVPKHCWNLHHRPFIKFVERCQVNWVRKSVSYWHAKSWDCLLTYSLPMKSINDSNSDAILSETKEYFWIFWCIFET